MSRTATLVIRACLPALLLIASVASAGVAPPVAAPAAEAAVYAPRVGDSWLDARLVELDALANDDRAGFEDELVSRFGAPRYLVSELLARHNWVAGDVYFACALAYFVQRPCGDVVREFESRGEGNWSTVSRKLGLRPGSARFQSLSSGTVASVKALTARAAASAAASASSVSETATVPLAPSAPASAPAAPTKDD